VIKLYGGGSANAMKIVIMLEELGLPYQIQNVNLMRGEQYSAQYLKLNPIGKIPMIVDDGGAAPGQPIFESGAILIYLAEAYQSDLLPASGAVRWEALKWLMAQVAWVGPMIGQHSHFRIHPSEAGNYASTRYHNQAQRVFQVLDGHLADKDYLAGDHYTVADIATWPWINYLPNQGFDWADYPMLHAWRDRLAERPAMVRGLEKRKQFSAGSPMNGPQDDEAFNRFFNRKSGPKVDFSVLGL
jgi:GST-like protein